MHRVRIQRDPFVSGFSFVNLKDGIKYTLELSVYNREIIASGKSELELTRRYLGKEYHLT